MRVVHVQREVAALEGTVYALVEGAGEQVGDWFQMHCEFAIVHLVW